MNPRVSRSSALASKATGFPIAKIAALLAVGLHARRGHQRHHRRDAGGVRADARLRRRQGPAVRVREVPRGRPALTSTMKSVGEVMAIGRTFREALGKAWRALERARADLGWAGRAAGGDDRAIATETPAARSVERAPARRRTRGRGRRGDRGSTRGSSTRSPRWSRRPSRSQGRRARRTRRRRAARGEAGRACRTGGSRRSRAPTRPTSARAGRRSASGPCSRPSTRAPASSRRATPYHYSTYEERGRGPPARAAARRDPRRRARTGSARGSSSTTRACTPRTRCARPATRR